MLVDAAEYQRHQEQLRGSKQFFETARKHGFEKPEAFEKYGKFTGTLKQKGLTLDQIMAAFEDPGQGAQVAEERGFDPAQIDKYLESKGYVTMDTVRRTTSESEYVAQLEREQQVYKAALDEFLGKDAPEWEREAWEAMAFKAVESKRYTPEMRLPEDHPLAKDYVYRPFKEPEIKSVFAELAKRRDLHKGQRLAAAGSGKPGGVSTPAGSSATAPSQLPKEPASNDKRPGGKPSLAEAEAWVNKRRQQRGGGPVSSVGG